MIWGLLFAAAALGAAILTGLVRRYALSRAMMDHPLERSSHFVPTPRGGGLAIALPVLATIVGAWYFGLIGDRVLAALGGGAVIIAWIGWLDDRGRARALLRGMVQVFAAVWTIAWLGGFPTLHLGAVTLELGVVGSPLAVVGIVWSINLYNFMDGIDGIAAMQGLCVGFFGGILLLLGGAGGLAAVALTISGTCAGFFFWNRTPAKIFMGDVGSASLGYIFAALAIASERQGTVPVLFWAVLASVFVFDATATLVLRVMGGHSWKKAHRGHAYQRATQAGFSHMQVTFAVLFINLLLGGVAMWMWRTSSTLIEGVLLAVLLCAVFYKLVGHLGRARAAAHARGETSEREHTRGMYIAGD